MQRTLGRMLLLALAVGLVWGAAQSARAQLIGAKVIGCVVVQCSRQGDQVQVRFLSQSGLLGTVNLSPQQPSQQANFGQHDLCRVRGWISLRAKTSQQPGKVMLTALVSSYGDTVSFEGEVVSW